MPDKIVEILKARFLYISLTLFIFVVVSLFIAGCGEKPPKPISLPSNAIERAAIAGLQASYRESTMWQIQEARAIAVTPVAPNALVLQHQDPKELYCVCVEYEARYKVGWSTTEASPWERTVRNLLVMRTQSDAYLAMKPMNICPAFCE